MSDHNDGFSRRKILECMTWAGAGVAWMAWSGVPKRFSLAGRAEAASAMAQTKPMIPVIVKDRTSLYWQTVIAGARKAGHDLGVKIVDLGAESESDVSGQISILEIAVASNPAAVVIAPVQFAALGGPIDEAAKKVKIIGIDSAADTALLTAMVATDNVQAGRIAADILADRIQKTYADAEGDVALITPSLGVAAFDQRAKGFREQIAARYGALDIVVEKVADGQATARNMMAEIITSHPELRGVFASDPVTAHGAAETLAENKTNKTGDIINLVGFDLDDQLVKLLQVGTIAALVVQNPFRMGYEGVKTALAASKGEQVPARIDTGASVITKANMNSARSQELVNPKVE
jgi:ribose transport system substrate-binding protein